MAEDLTDYLTDHGVKVNICIMRWIPSERMELIKDLRTGAIDAIGGHQPAARGWTFRRFRW